MKFLASTLLSNDPALSSRGEHERLRATVDLAVWAERTGYDGFGVGERRNPAFLSSSPAVLLSHIAARTETIRLFTTVTVLSLNDPVRVAEDYAMLDHLSDGRLEMIIGKGNDEPSLKLFGARQEEQWDRLAEAYELLRLLRGLGGGLVNGQPVAARGGVPPGAVTDVRERRTGGWGHARSCPIGIGARARNLVKAESRSERGGEVQSVARAGRLLTQVVDAPEGLSLTELAAGTALNISTVHRLLRTLCSQGLLCRDPVTERFLPGPVLLRLGRRSLVAAGLPEAVEVLRTLVEHTGETASVGVRDGQDVTVGLTVPSPAAFRYHAAPGQREQLRASALGLAILAFGAPLPEGSGEYGELLTVQFRGYAVHDPPDQPGLRSVAAPLITSGSAVTVAVEVRGPQARIGDDRLEEVARAVVTAAGALQELPLSLLLG
ncbi:LLM class flavin-dependent oxidoreductase [Nonomuraea sp. NPDC050404]|uniref:LLM class flavin-dependent oxidoreductase n=1 Tax=Nonomuraea sp. NPDC050404 TaxID=3155783 RepID=UPI0033CA149D